MSVGLLRISTLELTSVIDFITVITVRTGIGLNNYVYSIRVALMNHCFLGKEFEELYLKYEEEGRYKKRVSAQTVWYAIIESQVSEGSTVRIRNSPD